MLGVELPDVDTTGAEQDRAEAGATDGVGVGICASVAAGAGAGGSSGTCGACVRAGGTPSDTGLASFLHLSPRSRTTRSTCCINSASVCTASGWKLKYRRVPMMRPTTSKIIPCKWHEDSNRKHKTSTSTKTYTNRLGGSSSPSSKVSSRLETGARTVAPTCSLRHAGTHERQLKWHT